VFSGKFVEYLICMPDKSWFTIKRQNNFSMFFNFQMAAIYVSSSLLLNGLILTPSIAQTEESIGNHRT
jgi:hypothetical protein